MADLLDARHHTHTIIITWLDLANAYGSVRHNLIQFALKMFHVPDWFCHLVFLHYDLLFAKVVTKTWSTSVFQYLMGVFQCDPASPIFFNIVYQMCVNYAKQHAIEPYTFTDDHFDIRSSFGTMTINQLVYADDHTTVNSSIEGAQHTLRLITSWLEWTKCMKAKPRK